MKNFALTALVLAAFSTPVLADVIPSRRAEPNAAAERKVESRLSELGLGAAQVRHELAQLSPAETLYFAENPQRLQSVGGLYWYEFLLGLGVLVFLGVMYFWIVD